MAGPKRLRRNIINAENLVSPDYGMIPHTAEQGTAKYEVVFWEEGNPRSLVNMVPPLLRALMLALPPHLLALTEMDIRKQVKPDWVDEQLRQSFWDEYFVAIDNSETKIRLNAVYTRVCAEAVFYEVIKNQARLAYILHPPTDYIIQMRSLLNLGLERFSEILAMPLQGPTGVVNTRLIGEMIKIVTIIDNRVRGAVPQRLNINATSKNLHVHAAQPPKTYQEINLELKDIEKEINQLKDPSIPTQELFEFDGTVVDGK